MESLQPVKSSGYCQNCSKLISTMLEGGGLFEPSSLIEDTTEAWCLWPIELECGICKMVSFHVEKRTRHWSERFRENRTPGTVRVESKLGYQGRMQVISGFRITSSAGPIFDLAVWSTGGQVLIPDPDHPHEDDSDTKSSSEQRFLAISSRPPLESKYGKAHFDLIRSWLGTCRHHHRDCNTAKKKTLLPTRLIKIGHKAYGVVTLADTSGKRGRYCALSYCWGERPERHIKTTTETLYQHQTGIKIDHLPQVFKDAIRVTREIGLHYLWVDSLCIIQDDPEDWKAEASRMSEVYHNADLVIAAAGASDPSQGCFMERQMPPFPELQIATVPDTGERGKSKSIWIQEAPLGLEPYFEPLQKRGWALQETCLAQRSVHFMPSGMYWQCERLEANETSITIFVVPDRRWLGLLQTFSLRNLTKKEDRLFAIQGLVKKLQTDLPPGCRYQKGVFTHKIYEQILWSMMRYGDDDVKMEVWEDMPSWSWARISGKKWFWFMERDIGPSQSGIELTLNSDDVLRFQGYSTAIYIGDAVGESHDPNDHEQAVVDTAAAWRFLELYTVFQLQGNANQDVGFAGFDTDAVPLGDVTILFIAERTWDSVLKEPEEWLPSDEKIQLPALIDPPCEKDPYGATRIPLALS